MSLNLNTGIDNLLKSEGGRNSSYIAWKKGETKYVAFITPASDIPKVRFHQFVRIPTDDGFRWGTFMCRKDSSWLDDSKGECYLCDEIHHNAVTKYAAVAVELEPVTEGRRVKELNIKYKTGSNGTECSPTPERVP